MALVQLLRYTSRTTRAHLAGGPPCPHPWASPARWYSQPFLVSEGHAGRHVSGFAASTSCTICLPTLSLIRDCPPRHHAGLQGSGAPAAVIQPSCSQRRQEPWQRPLGLPPWTQHGPGPCAPVWARPACSWPPFQLACAQSGEQRVGSLDQGTARALGGSGVGGPSARSRPVLRTVRCGVGPGGLRLGWSGHSVPALNQYGLFSCRSQRC